MARTLLLRDRSQVTEPGRGKHRLRRWSLIGAGALLVGGALYFHAWERYVEVGLAEWAVSEVSDRTGGVYRLVLGDLNFRPILGSLSFDSGAVVTDTIRNQLRATPLPILETRAVGCRLSGVNVFLLLVRRRFDAKHMGCRSVAASVILSPVPAAAKTKGKAPPPDTLGVTAPREPHPYTLMLSRFRIAGISFPALHFSLRRPQGRGGTSFALDHAQLTADLFEFDPTAPKGAVSSIGLQIAATGLRLQPDTLSEFSIGRIAAGLTDSTLRLYDVAQGPTVTDSAWIGAQRHQRDRIRVSVDSVIVRGVAYEDLWDTGELNIRAVEVRGASLDILSDKRLKKGPKKLHDTPQQAAAGISPAIRVDTVLLHEGVVLYGEQKKDRTRPGRITFAAVQGTLLNVQLPSRGLPLVIDASARLMGAGLLSVHATVPLDAPDFRFDLTGELGPMSAQAFNPFLAETEPARIKDGSIDRVTFAMSTAKGVSKTTVTPRYRDLGVDITSRGGHPLRSLASAVIEVAANALKVHSDNPDEKGERPRTSTLRRTYDRSHAWIQFLWFSLRDPLLKVIVK